MSSNAASGAGSCVHCGASLEEKSLPEHMAQDQCQAWDAPERATNPHAGYEAPVLEEAPDTVDVDEDDLRRRRQLADRLEDEHSDWGSR